ncbi:MAG TPA: TetR/AcrR family transcriptional regulator [Mycobacteriales bacterium]|nr:TetR/AcrR family transcriptional regulator [Mycobacteriales bacterium]
MERPLRADAQRNRERILEVAAKAFAQHGVEASLEEIARQAGVGVGTLYRHFPNRDLLVEAVFRRNVDQLVASADRLLETLSPVEALAQWMREFVEYVSAKRGLASHLKTVVSAESDLFVSTHERMNAAIGRLVDAAVAEGSIRPDVAAPDVLRAMAGVCMTSDLPGGEEQACRISALFMDGLKYGCPGSASKPASGARRQRLASSRAHG